MEIRRIAIVLVLSRALNQSVTIAESLEVFLIGLWPDAVELLVLGLPNERFRRLTLRVHETTVVSEGVSITLIDTRGCKARLGVEAPRGISIRRGQMPV